MDYWAAQAAINQHPLLHNLSFFSWQIIEHPLGSAQPVFLVSKVTFSTLRYLLQHDLAPIELTLHLCLIAKIHQLEQSQMFCD